MKDMSMNIIVLIGVSFLYLGLYIFCLISIWFIVLVLLVVVWDGGGVR